MEHIFEQFQKTGYLHHAHVIEGDKDAVLQELTTLLETHLGVTVSGNPDIAILRHASFGIDEARSLSLRESHAAFSSPEKDTPSRKFFIIIADALTREAQNALLKTFEEPTLGTHFFIVVPRAEILLPTLRSRVMILSQERIADKSIQKVAQTFLESTLEERFAFNKKITETKKDEGVDREQIRTILDALEHILYERSHASFDGAIYKALWETKEYLSDRGSSAKMLLDNLAMQIPPGK